MRLTACDCRAEHYRVARRHGWMRLLPARRLYHCYACDELILLPPETVEDRLLQRGAQRARGGAPTLAFRGL